MAAPAPARASGRPGQGCTPAGCCRHVTAFRRTSALQPTAQHTRACFGVQYGSRRVYADILTPDFSLVCRSVGLPHERITKINEFGPAFQRALDSSGPCMIELDMIAIGPFSRSFAGPPAGAAGEG